MPVHDGQFSFANGEVSPDIHGRTDVALYKSSAKTLRNFLPSPHGPAYNRAGTYFCGLAKYNNTKTRLIPFTFSDEESYVLEFGDQYIRFWKNGGLILENDLATNSTPNTIAPQNYDSNTTYFKGQGAINTAVGFTYISLQDNNRGTAWAPSYWAFTNTWQQFGTGYQVGDYVTYPGTYRYFKCIQAYVAGNPHDPLTSPSYWLEVNRVNTSTSSSIIETWQDNESFIKDEYAKVVVGPTQLNVYRSLVNANIGNDPASSPLAWQLTGAANPWASGTSYSVNDMAYVVDGVIKFFVSKSNQSNHNPLTSGSTYWSQIINTPPYEVGTPYLDTDLPTLKYTQSADTIYLAHPSYAPQVLQRISDGNWTLTDYAFKNGPFQLGNTDTDILIGIGVSSDGINFPLTVFNTPKPVFTSGDVSSLFQLNLEMASFGLDYLHQINIFTSGGIYCQNSYSLIIDNIINATAFNVSIQKSLDNGSSWREIYRINISPTATPINYTGTLTEDYPVMVRFQLITALNGGAAGPAYADFHLKRITFNLTVVAKINSVSDPYSAMATFPNAPMSISAIGSSGFTTLWAKGSWSPGAGYPSCLTFLQDRLIWGATPNEPQTEWMTKTSNYVDFGRSSPLVDSDGITLNLTSRKVNAIKYLLTFLNSCIAFTSSSEWTTASDNGGAISPSTAYIKLQGLRGSGDVDPLMIGNRIIFPSPLGSCVREMVYQFYTDTFESENLSTKADHLFKGHSIVAMAYQQEPDSILWMVRDDGILISLTYLREQEVIAWAHHDTNGTFESIATIPGAGCDELWFVVKRGNNRYIERMIQRTLSTDPADQYFVDCGISYNGSPAQTLTGYDHLNGMTVAINADGFVLPQQVVSNGTVTLDKAHSKVQVGLPYVSDLETLNIEIPSREGVFQGTKYNLNRAIFRFLNSVGGQVGLDSDSLKDIVDMRDSGLDASLPTPLFSDYLPVTIPQSDDSRAHIFFRQVDPMPVTIVSIMPLVNPGKNP